MTATNLPDIVHRSPPSIDRATTPSSMATASLTERARSATTIYQPSVETLSNGNTVIRYDAFPAGFVPDVPAFAFNYRGDLYFSTQREYARNGGLGRIDVIYFRRTDELPWISLRKNDKVRSQLIDDYKSVVLQNAAKLICYYWNTDNNDRFHNFIYWFRVRPSQGDPIYARGLDPTHPLLKILPARDTCPVDRAAADASQNG